MFAVTTDTKAVSKQLLKDIPEAMRRASKEAVMKAAEFAFERVKANLSYTGGKAPIGQLGIRTGRLKSQVIIKTFAQKNGYTGASVQVEKGRDRRFVMHINEYGARSHGGRYSKSLAAKKAETGLKHLRIKSGKPGDRGPIPGRLVFTLIQRNSNSAMNAIYERAFKAAFKPHGGA